MNKIKEIIELADKAESSIEDAKELVNDAPNDIQRAISDAIEEGLQEASAAVDSASEEVLELRKAVEALRFDNKRLTSILKLSRQLMEEVQDLHDEFKDTDESFE